MSGIQDPISRKKALIEAAKNTSKPAPKENVIQRITNFIKPEDAKERIRIVFDNSGSMQDHIVFLNKPSSPKMEEAKKGVIEFLRNCTPNKDAVAVHLLNNPYRWEDNEEGNALVAKVIAGATLSTDLILLASSIDNPELRPTGGTPLFERILEALEATSRATRLVAFSDGEPNSKDKAEKCYSLAKELKISIDSVFFGSASDTGSAVMKEIAERTGGIYIVFDPSKGVNFASAFKYLSSGKRLMLMNEEFKKKLERGEIK